MLGVHREGQTTLKAMLNHIPGLVKPQASRRLSPGSTAAAPVLKARDWPVLQNLGFAFVDLGWLYDDCPDCAPNVRELVWMGPSGRAWVESSENPTMRGLRHKCAREHLNSKQMLVARPKTTDTVSDTYEHH